MSKVHIGYFFLKEDKRLIYIEGGFYNDTVKLHRCAEDTTAFWHFHSDDRFEAWNMLVEAGAGGADPERIRRLALHWGMLQDDVISYAKELGVEAKKDNQGYWEISVTNKSNTEMTLRRSRDPVEAMILLAIVFNFKPEGSMEERFFDEIDTYRHEI